MKTVLFSSSIGDIPAEMAFKNNLNATTAPGAGDDTSGGYERGSQWINASTGIIYQCVDATVGAAVWAVLSSDETTPGQIKAPDASTPTGTGGAASLTGGDGGSTSGAGGAASLNGGDATAGNSAGGAAAVAGGDGHGSSNGGAATLTGGTPGATGAGGNATVQGGPGGATSGDAGNANLVGGDAVSDGDGGQAHVAGGLGADTGAGGAVHVTGGDSGDGATGDGGDAHVTGGASQATDGNGGSIILTPGAGAGTGSDGVIANRGFALNTQGAQAAKTVSGTLTAADLMAGIITVNQGSGATSAQQLPEAGDLDAALPQAEADDSFDFSVINISTVDAEDASVTTNTGWTLVGNMDVPAYSAAGSLNSSGLFRARKTGAAAWTLYRIG